MTNKKKILEFTKIGSQKEKVLGKYYAHSEFRNKRLISIMEVYMFYLEWGNSYPTIEGAVILDM